MGKYIPVEPEKWAEMVKALALVKEMDKTINASQAECRRLKAEVERLIKAGDAMASALILVEMKSEEERQGRIKAWSAAKEGKQS